MNHKSHGQQPPRFAHDNGGYILIIALVVVMAIISVISIKTALSSISNLQTNNVSLDATQISIGAESCLEDSLLRLNWNNDYMGEMYSMWTVSGDVSCVITITGSGNDRTIQVTGTFNNNTQMYSVDVTLDPFMIVRWD